MFASLVPAAHVHHGHTVLVVFLRESRRGRFGGLQPLFDDAQMDASAVGKLATRPGEGLFEQDLGLRIFLLLEMLQGLFELLELLLDGRVTKTRGGTGFACFRS